MTFETIKRNYDRKLWNKSMVGLAVKKNVITAEQYQEITGEAYVAKEYLESYSEHPLSPRSK